jgi:WD40 repeat protein
VNDRPVLRRRLVALAILTAVTGASACGETSGTGPDIGGGGRPSISIVSGGTGSDTIGAALASPLLVEVRGADGRPASGLEVRFTVVADSVAGNGLTLRTAGATLSSVATPRSDGAGQASVELVFGSIPATTRIRIEVPSLDAQTTASYTIHPGNPDSLDVIPRDSILLVGDSLQITARVLDRMLNQLPIDSVEFTLSAELDISATKWIRSMSEGRGRVAIRSGGLTDSAFVSLVPNGMLALFRPWGGSSNTMGFAEKRLDGTDERWIASTGPAATSWAPGNRLSPQWLPGSEEIVYVGPVSGVDHLFIGSAAGPSRRVIEMDYEATREEFPVVSSDGEWIYYVGTANSLQAIWRVGVSGGDPERLTTIDDGRQFAWPTVAPDGLEVAYVARHSPGEDFMLYVLNISSRVARLVTPREAAGSVWSPTGEWILYAVSGPYSGYSGQLRMVRPDGTDDQQVIEGAYFPGGTWSPDGKYVVGVRSNFGQQLEVVDYANQQRMVLFNGGHGGPAWRRQ